MITKMKDINNNFEKKYKKLLKSIFIKGEETSNRTLINTYVLFNKNLKIDLTEGFPIITGKKIFFEKALAEFKWMFKGKTDLSYLHKHKVFWWDEFAKDNNLGKVYGYQIKKYNGLFDQIKYVIKEINNNSRRAIINLWNPCDLRDQALPCCFTQLDFVRINHKLNLSIHFRSSDVFLGLPYDIIVGALFLITIAEKCNLQYNYLALNLSNAHMYVNHTNPVKKYLNNKIYNLPTLKGNYDNYNLINYKSNEYLKADLVI